MPRHINAKPSTSGDRHDFSANGKRPDGNPSAQELISDAAAARTALAGPSAEAPAADERHEAKRPRHPPRKRQGTEADDRTPATGALPTMRKLEQARDDHSRKIVTQEADEGAEDVDRKAGETDKKE